MRESIINDVTPLVAMRPILMPRSIYHVPHSSPPLFLTLEGSYTPRLNPTIVLLSMIENMQPICRHFGNSFPPVRVFNYALIRTTIRNSYFPCTALTFNDACTALRGLAEYMALNNQFFQWRFQIWVNGYSLGSGRIEGIDRGLPEVSAAVVATS